MNKIDWGGWLLFFWFYAVICMTASAIKMENNNCGKSYPIEYFLVADLFCEIEGESGE